MLWKLSKYTQLIKTGQENYNNCSICFRRENQVSQHFKVIDVLQILSSQCISWIYRLSPNVRNSLSQGLFVRLRVTETQWNESPNCQRTLVIPSLHRQWLTVFKTEKKKTWNKDKYSCYIPIIKKESVSNDTEEKLLSLPDKTIFIKF